MNTIHCENLGACEICGNCLEERHPWYYCANENDCFGIYNTQKIVMIMLNSMTMKTSTKMMTILTQMNLLNALYVVMMHFGKEVTMNVSNADGVDCLMTIDSR